MRPGDLKPMLGFMVALVLFGASNGRAKCSRTFENIPSRTDMDSMVVEGTADGRPVNQTAINGAADQWDDCGGSLDVETNQTSSQPGQLHVEVRFRAGNNPGTIELDNGHTRSCGGGCGCVELHSPGGAGPWLSATIYSYERNLAGQSCLETMESFIAHELGHVLGLDDADFERCGTCEGRVMGASRDGGDVNDEDCMNADDFWKIPEEHLPQHDHPCQGQEA